MQITYYGEETDGKHAASMSTWVGAMEICHPSFVGISISLGNLFDGCGNHLKGMNEAAQRVGAGGGRGTFSDIGAAWEGVSVGVD